MVGPRSASAMPSFHRIRIVPLSSVDRVNAAALSSTKNALRRRRGGCGPSGRAARLRRIRSRHLTQPTHGPYRRTHRASSSAPVANRRAEARVGRCLLVSCAPRCDRRFPSDVGVDKEAPRAILSHAVGQHLIDVAVPELLPTPRLCASSGARSISSICQSRLRPSGRPMSICSWAGCGTR